MSREYWFCDSFLGVVQGDCGSVLAVYTVLAEPLGAKGFECHCGGTGTGQDPDDELKRENGVQSRGKEGISVSRQGGGNARSIIDRINPVVEGGESGGWLREGIRGGLQLKQFPLRRSMGVRGRFGRVMRGFRLGRIGAFWAKMKEKKRTRVTRKQSKQESRKEKKAKPKPESR